MVVWRVREQVVVRRGREEMVVRWGREEIVVRREGGGVQVEEGRVWVELCWGLCGDLTRWMRCLGKGLPFVAREEGGLRCDEKLWSGGRIGRGEVGGGDMVVGCAPSRKVVVEEEKLEEEK